MANHIIIDRDMVRKVLTFDSYCRKIRHWPLIKYNDTITSNMKNTVVTVNNDIMSVNINVNIYNNNVNNNIKIKKSSYHIHTNIPDQYKSLRTILERFHGKIYVCGGFIAKLLNTEPIYSSDVDIFFVGVSQEMATEILQSCLDLITYNHKKDDMINLAIDYKKEMSKKNLNKILNLLK